MKILVWQWGRRGAGPRFAACLAGGLRDRPGIDVALSLNRDAEIMLGPNPPVNDFPVRTYRGMASFLARLATLPLALPALVLRLLRVKPDLAICAMPGPLDPLMAAALRILGARLVVVVHDADLHLGDGYPMQMVLQRWLCRRADGLVALTAHVTDRLRQQGLADGSGARLVTLHHPPFAFGVPPRDRTRGPRRLLCFGRLLPYKGLDLLAAALERPRGIEVRIVGRGPESPALDALRACPNVSVENQWVPETEIGALLGWCDAIILPYREASQSGVAAAALAAGRPVIATRVGGLKEQLAAAPQAVLCDPNPESLGRAIDLWLEADPSSVPAPDADEAWREAASDLLQAMGTLRPRRGSAAVPVPIPVAVPAPVERSRLAGASHEAAEAIRPA